MLYILVKRFLSYPHPIRYYVYKRIKARFRPESYIQRILAGEVERPYYGYCMYQAARLASVLGHPKVSAIEFGVAGGNGLVNMEAHAAAIEREIAGVTFEIYGFDLETGLPPSTDYRDAPYGWGPGFYKMDRKKLEARLRRTRLVIGNVAETLPRFVETYDPAPIGAVMFDLDHYTSTRHAFGIFGSDPGRYLPRVQCSFDDTNTIEVVGELAAIREFNDANPSRKIGKIFAARDGWLPGGEKVFEFHDFAHPQYMHPTWRDGHGHMPLRD